MSPVIKNFQIFQPPNVVEQETLALWMAKAQSLATPDSFDERVIQKYSVKKSHIERRSFFSTDIGSLDFDNATLFNQTNNFYPNLRQRSEFYQSTVEKVFENLFKDKKDQPDEILHVTCTGYVSPSAGQKIIPANGWSESTGITHMYHMGCYAAMPAIKVARAMKDKSRIDIVHTEICSNHFDVSAQSPEQTVVQTLFADGAIKYSLVHNDSTDGIKVIEMKEQIIPDSSNAMTWHFAENNLEMTLHRSVPVVIRNNLKNFAVDLFKKAGLDYENDKADILFAIHPGGPKIIEQIVGLLDLENEQVKHSSDVLKQRGNMSSATLPHVWKSIVDDQSIEKNTKIFSVAFGPGLTVFGFIGEKV